MMGNSENALKMYYEVDDYHKESADLAMEWAKEYLKDKEGSGHSIWVSTNSAGEFSVGFAKPSWGGDHWGRYYDEFEEAVIMSVCEYFNGF